MGGKKNKSKNRQNKSGQGQRSGKREEVENKTKRANDFAKESASLEKMDISSESEVISTVNPNGESTSTSDDVRSKSNSLTKLTEDIDINKQEEKLIANQPKKRKEEKIKQKEAGGDQKVDREVRDREADHSRGSSRKNSLDRERPMFSHSKKKNWGKGAEPIPLRSSKNQPRETEDSLRSDQEVRRNRKPSRWSDDNKPNNQGERGILKQTDILSYCNKKEQSSKDTGRRSRSNSKSNELNFDYWEKNLRGKAKEEGTNVNEKFGDLFAADNEYSLGHCVAEDMNMGSGIATQFRSYFKRVDELLDQRVTQGGVAVLHVDNRYIYYLVTKRYSSGKPTYDTLFRALCKMREHVIKNEVRKIALPRIGCGLDGLEWSYVKSMLQYIFHGVNVDIVVYNFQVDADAAPPQQKYQKSKCPVVNVLKPVVEIEQDTMILYLCSVQLHINNEMMELDKKFNIVKDYRQSKRELGSVIRTEYRRTYRICGVVVWEKPGDLLSYSHFQNAISQINKFNKKEPYYYVAMQAIRDRRDQNIVSKLVNLMRNTFYDVHVYICWPKELEQFAPRESTYN